MTPTSGCTTWRRGAPYTDAERAALALAEAVTRLQDGPPGVTDEIWEEANAHFSEEQIGAINLEIALTNFFNRINRTIKEPAGKNWGCARSAGAPRGCSCSTGRPPSLKRPEGHPSTG